MKSVTRVVFAGTPAFSVGCLNMLIHAEDVEVVGVVSQPDRKSGRGMKLSPSPVKKAAVEAGIDVITPQSLRDNSEAVTWLASKDADILVVVAFGMILPEPWLKTPKIAPINVHASLLPRWRGAAPIERALLAGDVETGVGIMHMEQGLDTGAVYVESRIEIGAKTTGSELWSALADLGAELLLKSLPSIVSGELKAEPQDESRVTYAKKLTSEERVIDWSRSATMIDRQVRCFSPRPGARTMFRGKWLKIICGEVLPWEALINSMNGNHESRTADPRVDHLINSGAIAGDSRLGIGDSESHELPSRINQHFPCSTALPAAVVVDDRDLDISCGDGSVYRVLELQPEGKKAMKADAFLRGAKIKKGEMISGDNH